MAHLHLGLFFWPSLQASPWQSGIGVAYGIVDFIVEEQRLSEGLSLQNGFPDNLKNFF